ncbi:MAG: copper amine oxidase N-terminal domain-containing protein [Clostridia bacterium]|nr:copper amine oxidase N-terminal domain-containing protein [Clostridia bacterium]
MKIKRKSFVRKTIIILVLILLMGFSLSFGVGYSREITAWFYGIQVKLDGDNLQLSKEPFIYDGSVYIPLREVSHNLGIDVKWDGNNKTVYLFKDNDLEDTQRDYGDSFDSRYILNKKKDIDDIEDRLNDRYKEYRDGDRDLRFKYRLTEESGYIKVRMDGDNFSRSSSSWRDRGDNYFEDFIEKIAEFVADGLDDDVKIYVYDNDNRRVGQYSYDETRDDLDVDYEYSREDNDRDEEKEIEDELDDDYDKYNKGDRDLEFLYYVTISSSHTKVRMKGRDFTRNSSAWEDRNKSQFRDFVEEIGELAAKEFDEDVKIYVHDRDNREAAEYSYDEKDREISVEYEYDRGDDDSLIEEELNDNYHRYKRGEEDLEFEYEVADRLDYIKVMMKGDFHKGSIEWEKRRVEEFRDFAEEILEEVRDVFDDSDIWMYVYDKDTSKVAEYRYDEDNNEFKRIYEYEKH